MKACPQFLENIDCIADGLSAQGWMVIDDFFTPDLTIALRQECQTAPESGEWRKAAVGNGAARQTLGATRGDEIRWMQHPASSKSQRRFQESFECLRLALNRTLQLGLFEFESHFARYPVGAHYARHIDQFRCDTRRQLSCVLYLNENWNAEDGGQLRLYGGGDTPDFEDVLPTGGRLLVFLSARFAHEVLPATRERLSIAGWFKAR
ncbi:MAG: 2OG-Fe(II) oxygenase [Betaproteobacteria bacterium]